MLMCLSISIRLDQDLHGCKKVQRWTSLGYSQQAQVPLVHHTSTPRRQRGSNLLA